MKVVRPPGDRSSTRNKTGDEIEIQNLKPGDTFVYPGCDSVYLVTRNQSTHPDRRNKVRTATVINGSVAYKEKDHLVRQVEAYVAFGEPPAHWQEHKQRMDEAPIPVGADEDAAHIQQQLAIRQDALRLAVHAGSILRSGLIRIANGNNDQKLHLLVGTPTTVRDMLTQKFLAGHLTAGLSALQTTCLEIARGNLTVEQALGDETES